jgi:hypothetical protein
VEFTARDGALLQGTVFMPLPKSSDPYTNVALTPPFPAVVIVSGTNGSPAADYAWIAEDLAERGYVTLTFDVQNQGQSETLAHDRTTTGLPSPQESDFIADTEDAISFMLSTPRHRFAGAVNPVWAMIDHKADAQSVTGDRRTKLALIGHSSGALTVSYLQGIDKLIATGVALDKLDATTFAINDQGDGLPGPVVPRVPVLGVQAEYGIFAPQPYFVASCSSTELEGDEPNLLPGSGYNCLGSLSQPPNPAREENTGFTAWRARHIDSMVVVPRSSKHLDFVDFPTYLPASAQVKALASFYAQAWLAKYLKHDRAADNALLATQVRYLTPGAGDTRHLVTFGRDAYLSFYFCSGYAFHLTRTQPSSAGGRRSVTSKVIRNRALATNADLTGDGCK